VAGSSPEALAMTTELENAEPYQVRLKLYFWFYDVHRHCSREFPAGAVVSDVVDIEWLSAIGAPVEPAIYRR
jgi:hypothetical protein